jgi:hypothetical protein
MKDIQEICENLSRGSTPVLRGVMVDMRLCDAETDQWELCIAKTRSVICIGTRNQIMDLYDEYNEKQLEEMLSRKLSLEEWREIVREKEKNSYMEGVTGNVTE